MTYRPLPPIQQRLVIDLLQTYQGYREARQQTAQYTGGLSWKTLRGRQYLIKTLSRHGATKSHGPRSPATEALLADFVTGRAQAREREAALLTTVRQLAAMAKGTEVARVPVIITAILRKLDEGGLLGHSLIVTGSHALYGYEAVAGVQFAQGLLTAAEIGPSRSPRIPLTLAILDPNLQASAVWTILRQVDRSFQPVSGQGFKAISNKGCQVELLKPTSSPAWQPNMAAPDAHFPSIVIGRDGFPAPMVAPDPRLFALYQHEMSQPMDRGPASAHQARRQAEAVIALVRACFPHLPLDASMECMFPNTTTASSTDAPSVA